MNLKGKTAVVTGGAMGIGRATALRLIREQCTVTLWDLNESALQETAAALRGEGGVLFTHVCDVTDKARVAALAEIAVQEMGRVDSLLKVRDVTEIRVAGLSAMAQEELRQVIDRNNGHVLNMDNPTTTLEDLFLKIIRESEEHPGRRVRGVAQK
jgi:NAD(P)-dependent dehydrogenase (short-subunit alcohol dehydrogenase family)